MHPFSKKIICDTETPISLFQKIISEKEYAFLLESAESHERFGRYSIIGMNPIKTLIFDKNGLRNPLKELEREYKKIQYETDRNLPRLQAAFVGYFSYETIRHFETIKIPTDKTEIPESIFFLPGNLIIFDHYERSFVLIAYSKKELAELEKKIAKALQKPAKTLPINKSEKIFTPNSSAEAFTNIVEQAKEKIRAGEVFQIVVSQLFEEKTNLSSFELYRKLRHLSPSPYMFYLQYPDFSIVGSSPETLVRTEDEKVIVRPIAGTRRRGKNSEEEKIFEEELRNDEKEQAEHMMLVDLGRNDIGRIAQPGSVKVTELMKIEKYSHVMHLVSEVQGTKKTDISLFDIFQTAFPAGTLTGAPKIRAMEIIADLEKKPRDIYGGAVGYFDLSGNIDFAIAIRTMLYKKGKIQLRAGAGIVYDSTAKHEYQECCNKAKGPLTAAA